MDILGVFFRGCSWVCGERCGVTEFDRGGESPYDEKVGLRVSSALPRPEPMRVRDELLKLKLVPPRSMVGQLPLEQPIGVRIPGGQPRTDSKGFVLVLTGPHLVHLNH